MEESAFPLHANPRNRVGSNNHTDATELFDVLARTATGGAKAQEGTGQ